MSIANEMIAVRKIRSEVDRHLNKIASLAGTEEARDRLIQSWYARKDLQTHALLLDQELARLHDAEKRVLALKQDEDSWNTVFDNGKLCP